MTLRWYAGAIARSSPEPRSRSANQTCPAECRTTSNGRFYRADNLASGLVVATRSSLCTINDGSECAGDHTEPRRGWFRPVFGIDLESWRGSAVRSGWSPLRSSLAWCTLQALAGERTTTRGIRMPLVPALEQVLKTPRRAPLIQLLAGPTAPQALRSRPARADPQMTPPAVRGRTVARPELVAVCWGVLRMRAARGH